MEERPWKSDSRSPDQEIILLLCNQNINFHVHKWQPLDPILSQMNPVHTITPYFSKIHFNILSSTPRSGKWSLPDRFSDRKYRANMSFKCIVVRFTHFLVSFYSTPKNLIQNFLDSFTHWCWSDLKHCITLYASRQNRRSCHTLAAIFCWGHFTSDFKSSSKWPSETRFWWELWTPESC
jgi:hypothetical protein